MAKGIDEELAKDPMVSLFRKKKLIIALIVLFLLLATTIGVVTYYGLATGGYTINIDEELQGMSIELRESYKDENGTNQLEAPEFQKAEPIMQPQVNECLAYNNDGGYTSSAGNYIGYTFYLCNVGNNECDVESTFKIVENKKDVASAVRFWVFVSEGSEKDGELVLDTIDTTGTIYKKKESSAEIEDKYNKSYNNETKPNGYQQQVNWNENYTDADDENIIKTFIWEDFKPGDAKKITIIMWLEGNDPDCIAYEDENGVRQGILGGSLKIGMSFQAYHDELLK